jgi:pyrimidine-nucleoside phosphorylase
MTGFLPQQLIRKKRDGERLSEAEIRAFIVGVTDGSIADYQAAAMLMAVFLRGLDAGETAIWADAMVRSGDVLDLSRIRRAKIDKHSTGGVGDKISLPLAPAVAACGVAVPMVSGRGLGHTGGTLDKLEAIPGFRVDLPVERFAALVDELGACLIGQTERIAPADRMLYALRDVTATVESVPLIASSIMSKKLASGIDGLVLDCKVGVGAFMKNLEAARELARAILTIGEAWGKRVTVVLTDMDAPIGVMVGNALEVVESIEVLRGGGPADTRELTVRLGAEMLLLGGVASDEADAARRIEQVLDDGSALERFRAIVAAQGGDPRVCDDPAEVLPRAPGHHTVRAARAGTILAIGADAIGVAALRLGAGRRRKEEPVDPAVGVELLRRVGDHVAAGEALAILHHRDRALEPAALMVEAAFSLGDGPHAPGQQNVHGALPSRILEVLR